MWCSEAQLPLSSQGCKASSIPRAATHTPSFAPPAKHSTALACRTHTPPHPHTSLSVDSTSSLPLISSSYRRTCCRWRGAECRQKSSKHGSVEQCRAGCMVHDDVQQSQLHTFMLTRFQCVLTPSGHQPPLFHICPTLLQPGHPPMHPKFAYRFLCHDHGHALRVKLRTPSSPHHLRQAWAGNTSGSVFCIGKEVPSPEIIYKLQDTAEPCCSAVTIRSSPASAALAAKYLSQLTYKLQQPN